MTAPVAWPSMPEADIADAEVAILERLTLAGTGPGNAGQNLHQLSSAIDWYQQSHGVTLSHEAQRQLLARLLAALQGASPGAGKPVGNPAAGSPVASEMIRYLPDFAPRLLELSRDVAPEVMEQIDPGALNAISQNEQRAVIRRTLLSVCRNMRLELNGAESAELVSYLMDDMLGFGPLERALADDRVSDIMVNGAGQTYVERAGRLALTDITFRDDQHVMNIATRIVNQSGRRVDETTPLVDARLPDGSRINIIIPPLAIDGPTITIRKFPKDELKLTDLVLRNSMSPAMARFLRIAAQLRLNILISGGTGSGKTTLLNAISREISDGERIVTIEDAAELRLQQPHVVRLETRPPSIEGKGEISMRHLFRNALRMRPDRIIIGEVRSDEALDLLQAMNTGHDGSMSTLHANSPREALTRVENMIAMSGVRLQADLVRQQISAAVHLIVQVSRMRDGVRRVTALAELTGMDGPSIGMHNLFEFQEAGHGYASKVTGSFVTSGFAPGVRKLAAERGLERELMSIFEA